MNLRKRIKRVENLSDKLTAERFARMSDAELEKISAEYERKFPEQSARSKVFFQSLSDAELKAIYQGNFSAVSAQTLREYNELITI